MADYNKDLFLSQWHCDYSGVIVILRQYCYHHPEDFEGNFHLGEGFYKLALQDLAQGSFDKDNFYRARYYFSKAKKASQDPLKARIASKAYDNVKIDMAIEKQDGSELIEFAEKVSLLGETDRAVDLYFYAGNIFMCEGNFSDAINCFEKGLSLTNQDNQKIVTVQAASAITMPPVK
ncbi:MAG: tetratricopeptide repeat protein, partial [Desulfobacteraceae bacterium]